MADLSQCLQGMVMELVWEIEQRSLSSSNTPNKSSLHRKHAARSGRSLAQVFRGLGLKSPAIKRAERRRRTFPRQKKQGRKMDYNYDFGKRQISMEESSEKGSEMDLTRTYSEGTSSQPTTPRQSKKQSFRKRMKSVKNFFQSNGGSSKLLTVPIESPMLRRSSSLPSVQRGGLLSDGMQTVGRSRKWPDTSSGNMSPLFGKKSLISDEDLSCNGGVFPSPVPYVDSVNKPHIQYGDSQSKQYLSDSALYKVTVSKSSGAKKTNSFERFDADSTDIANNNQYVMTIYPPTNQSHTLKKEPISKDSGIALGNASAIDKKDNTEDCSNSDRPAANASRSDNATTTTRRTRRKSALTAPSLEDLVEADADVIHDSNMPSKTSAVTAIVEPYAAVDRNMNYVRQSDVRVRKTSSVLSRPNLDQLKEGISHSRLGQSIDSADISAEVERSDTVDGMKTQLSRHESLPAAFDHNANRIDFDSSRQSLRQKHDGNYDDDAPPADDEIRSIVHLKAQEALHDKYYDPDAVTTWCKVISNGIRDHFKRLGGIKRKIVVSTYIGSKDSLVDAVHVSVKCQYEGLTDKFLTTALESNDLYVWVTILLIENES